MTLQKSNKEKYNLIYKMINELSINEKCCVIIDLIEDMEIEFNEEMIVPLSVLLKAKKVVFENK